MFYSNKLLKNLPYRTPFFIWHRRCSSTLVQPTPFLYEKMANDTKLKERVERVQKEYEIYEYFSEFIPKFFGDKQWIQTLKCTSVSERVKFWGFLALSHHRRELDGIKHEREMELTERYLQEQFRLYNSGGMGYSEEAYCMFSNSIFSRSYAARKGRTIEQSKNLATQIALGEAPHILFDCQYFPQMNLRHYGRTSKTAAHTYFTNIYSPSPFPNAFINVDPKDSNTRDFFHYKIAHIATSRNWSIRPALYTNDPFHDPNETDPRKQVIYLSKYASEFMDGPLIHKAYVIPISFDMNQASFGAIKKGNYKGLAVPIRKYINWKSGPLFLPWLILLKILNEVRHNGGDWEYALNKYVPKRNLRTTEERKVAMGLRRYELMKERWNEKQRVVDLIIEALGEESGCILVEMLETFGRSDSGVLSLEQFQLLGTKRLTVLRKLEILKEKFGSSNQQDEYKNAFREEIGALMPLATNSCRNSDLNDARREDRISHFILRLAFCQISEQSDWFVRLETELFRMRFQYETRKSLASFLSSNDLNLKSVETEERSQIIDELSQALSLTAEDIMKTDLYKVDFVDVLELLSSHRVYLNNGTAFISFNELVALVSPRFRDNITASMNHARKEIGFLQENDRLIPLMTNIVKGGVSYRKEFQDPNAEHISPDMVDSLAHSSFPLCMRQIHFVLRREHHLRHFARRQFGLFLKGVGLSLEGALEFFRSEFIKTMDGEKFAKEYAYNIRHMYGKEGSRIDQKPLSCASIILGSSPAAQDCHGCPFKHFDVVRLGKQLEAVGLNIDQINHILDLSKTHRFDKACTKYFEFTHNTPDLEEIITHPNQFYSLSRKIRRGDLLKRKRDFVVEENDE